MRFIHRRQFLTYSAAALATPALPGVAFADWPKDRPIRALVPFNAGSSIDIIGRIVTDPLAKQLGQTIVIENRGGAGGSIGSAMVAKADPDGYTLLINAAAHSGAPAAYPNLTYDAAKDFACIASFGSVPNVLLVAPSLGVKTVQEFVAKAKAGNLTYSSAGVGSATHWAAERFRVSAGFSGTHVPFRGGLEALTEVMTGRVDFCFIGISSSMPFIKEGKLIPLAVSSAKRSPSLPNVPTTVEAGFANSDYNYWTGMLAPAKTPRAIIDTLHAEVTKVLALPDVQQKLAVQGVEPQPMSPTEMDAMNKREIELNLKIAKEAGLKFN
ncbi:tripartite tricarboxylate transporter substrate binding protein [Pseudolabrys taiwanensis]|uniref:Tripartite tricarboxylate transporter substrate binding protein n=1 Tax=Pseudolabrys taiwanensis TaxID=331696 RepID=A0A345ZWI1_9HYPH|nr:tripartite tricarboxylate transporter substrate-binding protein [Pseudolabrys taiwanensis]AXK81278.1 tripartite tricarboxylate transporter substrate binding protein [Pseudolabrys taiwanensis]